MKAEVESCLTSPSEGNTHTSFHSQEQQAAEALLNQEKEDLWEWQGMSTVLFLKETEKGLTAALHSGKALLYPTAFLPQHQIEVTRKAAQPHSLTLATAPNRNSPQEVCIIAMVFLPRKRTDNVNFPLFFLKTACESNETLKLSHSNTNCKHRRI